MCWCSQWTYASAHQEVRDSQAVEAVAQHGKRGSRSPLWDLGQQRNLCLRLLDEVLSWLPQFQNVWKAIRLLVESTCWMACGTWFEDQHGWHGCSQLWIEQGPAHVYASTLAERRSQGDQDADVLCLLLPPWNFNGSHGILRRCCT